jgi:hypothetical protein
VQKLWATPPVTNLGQCVAAVERMNDYVMYGCPEGRKTDGPILTVPETVMSPAPGPALPYSQIKDFSLIFTLRTPVMLDIIGSKM